MTSTKSVEAVSPLRRRMIEDMCVRKFGEKTQHDYIRHVEQFAKFLGRSPDTATGEDLRRYQVHQTESGVQPPTVNTSAVALRFLFTVTLGRANLATQLARLLEVVGDELDELVRRGWLKTTVAQHAYQRAV